jgi:lipoprotein-releasing system ATP-binding protein
MLKAKRISKTFYSPKPVKLFEDLNFEADAGETVAIMGRSGEGKSTLLHILGTLEDACSGELFIAGENISHASKNELRRKHIGFIFQSFHLLEDFSVIDNLLFPAKILRTDTRVGSEKFEQGMHLLEKVGLADRAGFLAKQLSGGEKQRVAIARALCNNPDIILADEPSGNLDGITAGAIHDLLMDLAASQHKTFVVVTHNKDLADLCQTKYMLSGGKLQAL